VDISTKPMTKEAFMQFYKGNEDASACYDAVKSALDELGILTDMTLIGALATVRTEVGRSYKPVKEIASGMAYEGRRDLGNYFKGDGVRYKGHGYLMVTGRWNFNHYGKKIGVDLVSHPDLALTVENSAKILAHYFKDRKVNVACDQKDWEKARKLVNGGLNGFDTFKKVVNDFLISSNFESIFTNQVK
jgi:putative chitinase